MVDGVSKKQKKAKKDTKNCPLGISRVAVRCILQWVPSFTPKSKTALLVQWVRLDKKRGVLCWQNRNAILVSLLVYAACFSFRLADAGSMFIFPFPFFFPLPPSGSWIN
jgi:hypothetical protein